MKQLKRLISIKKQFGFFKFCVLLNYSSVSQNLLRKALGLKV